MKVDTEDNTYCGRFRCSDGIHILNPGGERLSIVVHEEPATTNVCFGDSDWKSVLFTTREEARLLRQHLDHSVVT